MKDYEETEINKDILEEISSKVDELTLKGERLELGRYTKELSDKNFFFADVIDEARYLYIMGNCHQVLYQHTEMEWYSDDLSKAAIFFRKSLSILNKLTFPSQETLFLKSCIETNLANSLSAQGRALCCIPLWDRAIRQNNPVAMISKAQNELYLAQVLYDPGHQEYHLFVAYKLIT